MVWNFLRTFLNDHKVKWQDKSCLQKNINIQIHWPLPVCFTVISTFLALFVFQGSTGYLGVYYNKIHRIKLSTPSTAYVGLHSPDKSLKMLTILLSLQFCNVLYFALVREIHAFTTIMRAKASYAFFLQIHADLRLIKIVSTLFLYTVVEKYCDAYNAESVFSSRKCY